jgi:hypothetical protein
MKMILQRKKTKMCLKQWKSWITHKITATNTYTTAKTKKNQEDDEHHAWSYSIPTRKISVKSQRIGSSAVHSQHQISLYITSKDNIKSAPSARRYSDEIKEFALTLYFYSPRTYKYVRSLIWLFTYGKKYTKEIASENNKSIRHKFKAT